MACNNTTYIDMVRNSTELINKYSKYSFVVENWSYNVPVAMLINKSVTPIWTVIGIFGNIVSAMVWANPRMRTCNTVAYYLTCLAVADLTFLVLHFIYELENPWLLGTLDVPGWCQIFSMANMAVQYFCVFLVFAFTVERFLSVCHPFKSERFSKTRTPRTIFFLFTLALILSLPQGYFWEITFVGECQFRPSESQMLTASFFSIYTWSTELAIFLVLPVIVLLLNIAVLHRIRGAGQLRIGRGRPSAKDGRSPLTCNGTNMSSLGVSDSNHSAKRLSRCISSTTSASHKGTTVTLLWVSFFLIFTMLPNTIMYALQLSITYGPLPCKIQDMALDPAWDAYFTYIAVKIIIKEISLSHHVGNVFIYMATSRRFFKLTLQSFSKSKSKNTELGDASLQTIRSHNGRSVLVGDDV